MKSMPWLILAFSVLVPALPLAAGEPLPAPPPGYAVQPLSPSFAAMKDSGLWDGIEAVKPSDTACADAPLVSFGYGWKLSPGAERTVEMMFQRPPEGVQDNHTARTEPLARTRYEDGVLEWTKTTTTVAMSCAAGLVTYDGTWIGAAGGRLLTIGVHDIGSREAGQALIDAYVGKLIAVAESWAEDEEE